MIRAQIQILLAGLLLLGCAPTREPTSQSTAPADTTTSPALEARIEALYDLETRLLQSITEGNEQRAAPLLDHALSELRALVRNHPDVTENPEFQRLYRSFISEYRTFHGHRLVDSTAAQGRIFDLRSALFRKLGDETETLASDAAESTGGAVPMPDNRLVRKSIRFLTDERQEVLDTWENRAETYFPMIEHILEEEGVPENLKYLALVESGLNPDARSWAGAVGMWQFIPSTGRNSGLRITRWVDERRDPEKATRAAARHLRELYEEFGDWHLAMAAYNCGGPCVKRALRRSSEDTFWGAYGNLPRETRGYVPMFVATARIFDSREVQTDRPYAYEAVTVEGPLQLRAVSETGDLSAGRLEQLNPELRRGRVPPGEYQLKVPPGTAEELVRKSTPDSGSHTYTVHRGDALGLIAQRFDTTVRALMGANQLRSTTIHPGQRLEVPGSAYNLRLVSSKVQRVDYDEPNPALTLNIARASDRDDQSPSNQDPPVAEESAAVEESTAAEESAAVEERSDRSASSEKQNQAQSSKAPQQEIHVVRSGQSLWEISRAYGVSIPTLAWTNRLESLHLRPGQRLNIESSRGWPSSLTVRVRYGDTLSELSSAYGVSAAEVRQWNSLGSDRIYAGQRLQVYAPGKQAVHEVKRGQTLSGISRRYGVPVSKLRQWNSLESSVIRPGQRIIIQEEE